MKSTTRIIGLIMCLHMIPAYSMDFWHSNTVWAGQGQCAATFTFDSGGREIRNLSIKVDFIDESDNKVDSGTLNVDWFGRSSAERYSSDIIEGHELCNDELVLIVTKATAVLDGCHVDLLAQKVLTSRNFKPFKIMVPGSKR